MLFLDKAKQKSVEEKIKTTSFKFKSCLFNFIIILYYFNSLFAPKFQAVHNNTKRQKIFAEFCDIRVFLPLFDSFGKFKYVKRIKLNKYIYFNELIRSSAIPGNFLYIENTIKK